MKSNHSFLSPVFLALACMAPAVSVYGQCATQVFHLSGTSQVGCTAVTVTPNGVTSSATVCSVSPYWIGCTVSNNPCNATGSYTFNFSLPVASLSIDISSINNNIQGEEEVNFEVNGLPYFCPPPTAPNACNQPLAVLTPTGGLGACAGCLGGCKNLTISGPVSSLKVIDVPISGMPSGVVFSLFICPVCCTTNAGMLNAAPLSVCISSDAVIQPATQTFLDSDDILQYVLCSDVSNPLGSIIATSATPHFSFDPAVMETGIAYYIVAIAGNNAGGTIDPTDPCLDISNAVTLIWKPTPTVFLSVLDDTMCEGSCKIITATFTGTAPYSLTYQSGNSAPITQVFPFALGSFQVCTPLGSSMGTLEVQSLSITDANCTCP